MNSIYLHGLAIAAFTFGFVLFLQIRLTTNPLSYSVVTKGLLHDSDGAATGKRFQHDPTSRILATTIAEHDRLAPKVAWIMSFPLSGGDYVVDVIHRLTQKATGTNYGNVLEEPSGTQVRNTHESVPMYHERDHGPYFFVKHLAMPISYIPVSTYCTGYCWDCYPGRYAGLKRKDFVTGCVTATMFKPSNSNNGMNGLGISKEVQYSGDLVKKAVIMVRNPFDAIEERFLYSTRTYATDKEWIPRFEPNPRGFHDFCAEAEAKYDEQEQLWYQPSIYQASRGVPCHHEFFKLIQWYNYAFETLEEMGLEPKLVYYEDLANTNTFAHTSTDMLSFFELTPVVDPAVSQPLLTAQGPTNYLSNQEKTNVQAFLSVLALSKTTAALSRYFSHE